MIYPGELRGNGEHRYITDSEWPGAERDTLLRPCPAIGTVWERNGDVLEVMDMYPGPDDVEICESGERGSICLRREEFQRLVQIGRIRYIGHTQGALA